MKLTHLTTTIAVAATIAQGAPVNKNTIEARSAAPNPEAASILPEKRDEMEKAKRAEGIVGLDLRDMLSAAE